MIKTAALEITDKCNLSCAHCYFYDYISTDEMDFENIVYTLKKVSAIENLNSIAISGGEPLLHSRIVDILEICGTEFNEKNIILITNGILINDEILNLFSLYKNITINLSLEGSSKDINDRIRGNGTYDKIIELTKKISEIDNNRLNLRMTISKYNYKDIVNFFHLARKYNVNTNYLFIVKSGAAKLKWDELGLSVSNKIYCYNELKKIYKEFNIGAIPPSDPGGCGEHETLCINMQGNIYLCTLFPDDFIGNIFEDTTESLEKIMNNNSLTERIDVWQKKLLESECQGCEILNFCQQGCYGQYIINNEDNDSENQKSLLDGLCVSRKYKYLLDNLSNDQEVLKSKEN